MANNSDFESFYKQCTAWRKHLLRTYRTFVDIDAEIDLSMWQHYCNGVLDEREMFRRVTVDVRRYVRGEVRQSKVKARLGEQLSETLCASHTDDQIRKVIDDVGNQQRLAKATVPDRARAWVVHASAPTPTPISNAQRMAGRRWAQGARKVLADA